MTGILTWPRSGLCGRCGQNPIQASKAENEKLRWRAATVLGKIGPEAREAVPVPIQAVERWSVWGQDYAAGALEDITGKLCGKDVDRLKEW